MSLAQLEQAKWVLREHGAGTRTIFDSAIHDKIPDLNVVKYIERGELVALNVPELNMERTLSFIWRSSMDQNLISSCIRREGIRMIKDHHIIR